jgi:hypothetical protein
MTTVTEEAAAPRRTSRGPGEAKPAPTIKPPTKGRRRPALIALGVALVIIGGLATWYLTQAVSDTETVLTTSSSIARGEEITAGDLTTIEIAGGQNVSVFTASDAQDVIGQVALVDIPAGALVTPNSIGDTIAIENGQSIVGVALTSAQLPSYPLAAGDVVRIVETPVSQGDPPATTPATFEAVVFTTRFDEATSQTIVDLIVPESRAADIAARSATGRIALVVDSGRR